MNDNFIQDNKTYPGLICVDCAVEYDGNDERRKFANYYSAECGWCGKFKRVTMPKNWGYPRPPKNRDE